MNILIVHNYYKIPGGEDTVVKNEKKLLEDHGNKVVLYTRHNSELDSMTKLQKLKLPFTTIYNKETYNTVKKIIKENDIDVVHVHNTLNLVSPSVYYAAIKCKVPVYQTMHNFRLECMGACFYRDNKICEDCLTKGNACAIRYACYRGSKVQTLACLLSNWYHRCTGVYKKINYIALTEFNKEKLLQWKHNGKPVLKPEQIYIKPNFTYEVNTDLLPRIDEEYYLFVGRVEKIKGIEIIIDAFTKLKGKKIKIAGTGTELAEYKNLVAARGLDNIEFLGFRDREEINRLMYNAKAVIVASQWYETFGMIVAESYAVGTPVIAGDIGNIGNIVEDNITGIKFRYDSADALVEAINKFETKDRKDLSLASKNKFEKEFSPEVNYRKFVEIWTEKK